MPTPIVLPDCLREAYSIMFPTLNLAQVNIFDGIPFILNKGQRGITVTSGLADINIYLREGEYDPCSPATFSLLAHELTHALQIQGTFLSGAFNTWIFRYVTCTIASLSSERGNAFENEAYDFEAQVDACPIKPCVCGGVPWLATIPNLDTQLPTLCPNLIKSEAKNGLSDCLAKRFTLPFIGTIWNLISIVIGLIVTIAYTIVDWVVSAFQFIIDAITDFFSGDGVGGISIIFSSDGGLTFGNKITMERSSEPPALATSATEIYVGWTGTDNRLNVFFAPNPRPKTTFDRSNDDSGPALVFAFGQIFIVWQNGDNHLHSLSSPPPTPALNFGGRLNLGESLGGDVTPGLAFGQGRLYLAWIDDDEHILIKSSTDGTNFGNSMAVNEKSGTDGTPALAFGNGRLFLAWAGTDDDNHLNVKVFQPVSNGGLQTLSKVTLQERSSDDAGPALAFGNGRLFLAWTDNNQRLNIASSADAVTFENKRTLGHSSDNAGPALSFGPGNIISVAWIDK